MIQENLFDMPQEWEEHWQNMPDFQQENKKPHSTITVQFDSQEDREAFLSLLGEHPARQKSIWFPQKSYLMQSERQSVPVVVEPNIYPIYVISKGRSTKPLTSNALTRLGIRHALVIEPQEEHQYREALPGAALHILPFSNLGQGSIPARNWVWNHAVSSGYAAHWILDDNMDGFYQLNNNLKKKVIDFNPFLSIEKFYDVYENIGLAGMQYEFFVDRRSQHNPYILNTRIYSCILINHALPFQWRGRYNEDTDLSLRALKDGWCTVLFNHVLCKKMPTMSMAGGNTDTLYQGDGRYQMAAALQGQHPDVVTITTKWGRPQHLVNYTPFKRNILKRKHSEHEHGYMAQCPDWCHEQNRCNLCRAELGRTTP